MDKELANRVTALLADYPEWGTPECGELFEGINTLIAEVERLEAEKKVSSGDWINIKGVFGRLEVDPRIEVTDAKLEKENARLKRALDVALSFIQIYGSGRDMCIYPAKEHEKVAAAHIITELAEKEAKEILAEIKAILNEKENLKQFLEFASNTVKSWPKQRQDTLEFRDDDESEEE